MGGARRPPAARRALGSSAREIREESPVSVEYLIRDARVTDVERITTLQDAAAAPAAPSARTPLPGVDLLRQLVYLPQAVVLVAELRRTVVGAVVLALRPSVSRGGFVASVDLLVVDEGYERSGVLDALINQALRSARNKGCVMVEAEAPADPAERSLWEGHGFVQAAARVERLLASNVPTGAASDSNPAERAPANTERAPATSNTDRRLA